MLHVLEQPETSNRIHAMNTYAHPFHIIKRYIDLFRVYFKSFALEYINLHACNSIKHQQKEHIT